MWDTFYILLVHLIIFPLDIKLFFDDANTWKSNKMYTADQVIYASDFINICKK